MTTTMLTEAETCRKHVVPKLQKAGWAVLVETWLTHRRFG